MEQKEHVTKEFFDYSLLGKNAKLSVEKGLAEASWYTSPVSREKMRELLVRKNGPAIRDTILWFGLIFGSAALVVVLWGTWWFLLPYLVYTVLYSSTSDSRWHESSHGTAFRSGWMNNALYEIASFMVLRQSTVWRWSHTRHHSDTLVRGRDPEIAAPRPPNIKGIIMNFFALRSAPAELRKIFIHASGRIDKEVATYLPHSEYRKVYWKARIYLLIFALVITASIVFRTPLPVMFIGLPTLFGTWLMPLYGLTQHAGLSENVLDHRLNCRTVYMNRVNRFLYWNMNYHIEHHMFPLVPYHALPRLHEEMKNDCPPAYGGIAEAFREIIPTLRKQVKDPSYFVVRTLPEGAGTGIQPGHLFKASMDEADENGLVRICHVDDLVSGEVVRFDLDDQTFAVYKLGEGRYYMTEGVCTHGNSHLSDGLIVGEQIECSKHNGRFNISDGSPQRLPVCDGLRSYEVHVNEMHLCLDVGLARQGDEAESHKFRVVSNQNLATFIKELVLEPFPGSGEFKYQPGDYMKVEIPSHQTGFGSFEIDEPYRKSWKELNAFRYHAFNAIRTRRNYSLATNPDQDKVLKFNVRIALPPMGVNCYAGLGSTYVFNLKPGDMVKTTGPFGEFHINESEREMVFVGGGAGMAPLRSQISWLFESQQSKRRVSYWYGARSESELFYEDYFRGLEAAHGNFDFHVALSDSGDHKNELYHLGFIHDILEKEYLFGQENIQDKEFYLCGPPAMIEALRVLLNKYQVTAEQVRFDEF